MLGKDIVSIVYVKTNREIEHYTIPGYQNITAHTVFCSD